MSKQQARERAVSLRVELESNVGASTMDLIDEYVQAVIASAFEKNAREGRNGGQ